MHTSPAQHWLAVLQRCPFAKQAAAMRMGIGVANRVLAAGAAAVPASAAAAPASETAQDTASAKTKADEDRRDILCLLRVDVCVSHSAVPKNRRAAGITSVSSRRRSTVICASQGVPSVILPLGPCEEVQR